MQHRNLRLQWEIFVIIKHRESSQKYLKNTHKLILYGMEQSGIMQIQKKNTTLKKYSKTTGKYGLLPFTIYCSGANIPTRAFSIKMNLITS